MVKTKNLVIALIVTLIWAGNVAAGEVEDVLAKADSNLTDVKDQTYNAELEVIRDEKIIKTLKFTAKLKGVTMKVVKFTAPGDVRGMSLLTTADGLMYVYLPSYKRVRRVAAHVRHQGFMGTDISPDEMASGAISDGWHAKIVSQDDKVWVLELKPKAGNETSYSRQIVTVSKEHEGVEKVESYNSEGKLVKSQVRTEWKSFGVIHIPTVFTYIDNRTGSITIIRFLGCEVNKGIPDSAFTQRALMRGD
jgi:outer membrane lipoprotein-sorting protein